MYRHLFIVALLTSFLAPLMLPANTQEHSGVAIVSSVLPVSDATPTSSFPPLAPRPAPGDLAVPGNIFGVEDSAHSWHLNFDIQTGIYDSGKDINFVGFEVSAAGKGLKPGEFNITNWDGYPAGVPKPQGPFTLLDGPAYQQARTAANKANQALHKADPSLQGLQLHEIKPVKFGGSPIDPANKIPLTQAEHTPLTNWWNQLQRTLQQ